MSMHTIFMKLKRGQTKTDDKKDHMVLSFGGYILLYVVKQPIWDYTLMDILQILYLIDIEIRKENQYEQKKTKI